MSDLISRSYIVQQAQDFRGVFKTDLEKYVADMFIRMVDHAPAVDAVPVVRCKGCIRRGDSSECPMCFEETIEWDDDGYMETECVTHDYTADWGFCDRGERKDDGENESK